MEAGKKNEPAEYDSFVKNTDKLRAQGGGNFDQREVTRVANLMRKVVENGGNIEDVYSDGKGIDIEKKSDRPKSLSAVRRSSFEGESENSNAPVSEKLKGVEYFKSNFGEMMGEEIYDNLVAGYGEKKLKDFKPFYNNGGKQTYAQVVKQLNENVDVNKRQEMNERFGKPSKIRSSGGKHEQ